MAIRTPLYDLHLELNGQMVDFAGFELPIQYSSIIKEHNAIRNGVGLFDVSHMGQFFVSGAKAREYINFLICNAIMKLAPGRIRYSPLLNEDGGIIDDLLIYCIDDEHFMVVVNASNIEKDYAQFKKYLWEGITLENRSSEIAQIALQGPKAEAVLSKLTKEIPEKYYSFIEKVDVDGIEALVSRTGYTGEDGFELYLAAAKGIELYKKLMEAGAEYEIQPCGLGARDTLRMEAAMPLYGHEMNDSTSPFEVGLGRYVKLEKADFVGKEALEKRGEAKVDRIGLKVIDKGILREHCPVKYEGEVIGETTSGTYIASQKVSLAMAIVKKEYCEIGKILEVEVRGKDIKCEVVALPFYKKGE